MTVTNALLLACVPYNCTRTQQMHYAGLSGRVECGEWLRKEKSAVWPKTVYDEAIVNREAVMRCWSLPFVKVPSC
jgi:hypothetical protein